MSGSGEGGYEWDKRVQIDQGYEHEYMTGRMRSCDGLDRGGQGGVDRLGDDMSGSWLGCGEWTYMCDEWLMGNDSGSEERLSKPNQYVEDMVKEMGTYKAEPTAHIVVPAVFDPCVWLVTNARAA